jgi:hypothetical protein
MFKKKQSKDAAGRRRPATTNTTRPAFSYHAARQRDDDGSTRQRVRLDDALQLDHAAGFCAKLTGILMGNVVWSLAAAGVFVLVLVNISMSVSNSQVVIMGTPDERALMQPRATYEKTTDKLLGASFANRFKPTVDARQFQQDFVQAHPEVADVQLEVPLVGQQPTVRIIPAKPALELISSQQTYTVGTTGFVIAQSAVGGLAIPRVQDEAALQVRIGEQALSSGDVRFIQRLQYQLAKAGIDVTSYTIPTASRQLHMQQKGKAYTVRFSFEADVLQQAGGLVATTQKLDTMKTTPSEYIDVRLPGRVYYK